MKKITLGHSDLHVTAVCLGTMTFGEQVPQNEAHDILSRSLDLGINSVSYTHLTLPTICSV